MYINVMYTYIPDSGYHLGEFGQQVSKQFIFVKFHSEYHLILKGEKRQPYEENIRVPLIVRGPNVPKNKNTSALALNIDMV